MDAKARVIPWSTRPQQGKESTITVPVTPEVSSTQVPDFAALDGVLLVLPDEQLDALGTIFASSPLRRAMTFEAYLIVKGYGQGLD